MTGTSLASVANSLSNSPAPQPPTTSSLAESTSLALSQSALPSSPGELDPARKHELRARLLQQNVDAGRSAAALVGDPEVLVALGIDDLNRIGGSTTDHGTGTGSDGSATRTGNDAGRSGNQVQTVAAEISDPRGKPTGEHGSLESNVRALDAKSVASTVSAGPTNRDGQEKVGDTERSSDSVTGQEVMRPTNSIASTARPIFNTALVKGSGGFAAAISLNLNRAHESSHQRRGNSPMAAVPSGPKFTGDREIDLRTAGPANKKVAFDLSEQSYRELEPALA